MRSRVQQPFKLAKVNRGDGLRERDEGRDEEEREWRIEEGEDAHCGCDWGIGGVVVADSGRGVGLVEEGLNVGETRVSHGCEFVNLFGGIRLGR